MAKLEPSQEQSLLNLITFLKHKGHRFIYYFSFKFLVIPFSLLSLFDQKTLQMYSKYIQKSNNDNEESSKSKTIDGIKLLGACSFFENVPKQFS